MNNSNYNYGELLIDTDQATISIIH